MMSVREPKLRQQYLEVRPPRRTMNDGLATDLAKHLHTRQHLGSAVIITSEPLKLLAVVRKQWFKLARHLQRERAGTVNAQKILHLTYAVTRMHKLTFVAKTPEQQPNANVFFVPGDQLQRVPPQCYSLYLTTPISQRLLERCADKLPNNSLVVDYADTVGSFAQHLQSKEALSEHVRHQWQQVLEFLHELRIDIQALAQQAGMKPSAIDEAIDLLLDYSDDFLRVAGTFQYTLQLAQPLEPPHETQREYNTLTLLAHRVQTLHTGKLSEYLDSIVADNSFFLRDVGTERDIHWELAALLAYHRRTGHKRTYYKLMEISGFALNFSELSPIVADI